MPDYFSLTAYVEATWKLHRIWLILKDKRCITLTTHITSESHSRVHGTELPLHFRILGIDLTAKYHSACQFK